MFYEEQLANLYGGQSNTATLCSTGYTQASAGIAWPEFGEPTNKQHRNHYRIIGAFRCNQTQNEDAASVKSSGLRLSHISGQHTAYLDARRVPPSNRFSSYSNQNRDTPIITSWRLFSLSGLENLSGDHCSVSWQTGLNGHVLTRQE